MTDTMKERNQLPREYLHCQDNQGHEVAGIKVIIRSIEGISTRAKVLVMENCSLNRDVRSFVIELSHDELCARLLEKDPKSRMSYPQSYQVHERIVVSLIRLSPAAGSASARLGDLVQTHLSRNLSGFFSK